MTFCGRYFNIYVHFLSVSSPPYSLTMIKPPHLILLTLHNLYITVVCSESANLPPVCADTHILVLRNRK